MVSIALNIMNLLFIKRSRRHIAAMVLMLFVAAMIGAGLAQAQDSVPHTIKIGDIVTGTLNVQNFAQVYSFSTSAGATVSIVATSKTKGLTLAMLLTDASGVTLGKSADLTKTEVAIRDFKIPADGVYYITLMRGTGAQGGATGEFALALSGSTAAPPSNVALAQGMSVSLSWTTTDDMNLEVRDPIGG